MSVVQVEPRAHAAISTIIRTTSLSDVIDLEGYDLVGIEMPSGWDAANLTFKVAEKIGGTFQDLYDDAGTEVTVTAAASRCIKIGATATKSLAGLRFLKIRSGTAGSAVNQTADRTLLLLVRQGA